MSNAPGLISDLTVPSLLYLQEIRRATFEPSYRQRATLTPFNFPGQLVTEGTERLLAARDRRGVAAATAVACNSVHSSERILASYGRTARVLALGVDERTFRYRGASDSTQRVLAVGGLEPFKNQLAVVRAIGTLDESRRPRLALVYERCDPRYRELVLAEARRASVSIEEHLSVSDDALAGLYSSSAATVLAAQLEPFGLTALESIACGTPVVAVREAGYRETVIDGVNGLLVPRSEEALAAALSRVLLGSAGLSPRDDLPATILPFWSQDESARRQLDALREVANG